MDDNALHELTAPYALDALDADERRAYEAHLARCDRCRDDLASFSDTAGLLAYAAAGPAPPAQLRKRILSAAAVERENVVPLVRRRAFQAVAGVAAVAVAAVIGLAVWAASLSSDLSSKRAALADERRAAAIMATPGARRIPLTGRTGTLVVAPSGEAALAVQRLPAAPAGKTYELWVIPGGGGKPKPAGFLRGGGSVSTAVLRLRVPGSGTVAATVEPGHGSPQPTSKPFLTAET
jgi:anti-sigma-K factor RskA